MRWDEMENLDVLQAARAYT